MDHLSLPNAMYGNDSASILQSVATLPAYTRRPSPPPRVHRELTEHSFELFDKRSKPWVSLKMYSNATCAKSLPAFVEGDKITGAVSLDLEHGDHISSISLVVQGKITTGNSEDSRFLFLETTTDIWSRKMGNPTAPSNTRFSGPLIGAYKFPFAISLPKEVLLGSKGRQEPFRLPASFLERHSRACVYYDISLHISRSSKFRQDSEIQTMFYYVPATRPDPPSILRQVAYQENSPIPGPDVDPEGWYTLPPAKIKGMLFSTRSVELTCSMHLPKPLSYTRGSCIPLALSLTSSDTQALDLLSNTQVIVAHLRRRVAFQEKIFTAELNCLEEHHEHKNCTIEKVGSAVWWPLHEGSPNTRQLAGEIRLAKDLKPTSAIDHFSLEYFVTLMPLEATGFVRSSYSSPVLEQKVGIVTRFPKGPRPIMFSPPTYELPEE